MNRPEPADTTTLLEGGDCAARGRASYIVRNFLAAQGRQGVSGAHAPPRTGRENPFGTRDGGRKAATGGGP